MFESGKKLAELIEQGGVYASLKGNNLREVLAAFTGALPPALSVPREKLLGAVLEREKLMSTSIGKGIALPHPRTQLIDSPKDEFVAVAYLENPVDWNSLDGERVDTLMLIISAAPKHHLELLSKINYLCRQENFFRLLKARANLEELVPFIRDAEKKWT